MNDHIVQAATLRWYNACAYYAAALAEGMNRLGKRVTFASITPTPASEKVRERGIESYTPDEGCGFRTPFFSDAAGCRRFARETGVTLVNAHTGADHLLWAFALRGTGIPLVRTSGNQLQIGRAHV